MPDKPRSVPVAGPSITQKEIDYVTQAVTDGWYGNANAWQTRFERAFADYCGVQYAIGLPSCTAAIHLALAAMNISAGDEVIVPDITWIASAAPVTYVGAETRFADVDRATWCMDPRAFESLITPRTRAVIPVDLYGNMADLPAICDIARKRDIYVVEDAAEAVGASIGARKSGSFGDVGVFSFHGSKTLTTGEGGIFLTNRKDLYERALVLRDHGRRPGDRAFYNREVAFKYKWTAMQAALGLAQLERIDELLKMKREAFRWYKDALAGMDGIALNEAMRGSESVYWMVTAIVDRRYGLTKDVLQDELSKRGIDTRPFFYPLSSLPAYERSADAAPARKRNVVSYDISPYGINLPSSLSLTRDDVARVADAMREITGQRRSADTLQARR